ncbi:MAG: helix-turn-helix domain-containing protein [Pseudomonadota bacterium]
MAKIAPHVYRVWAAVSSLSEAARSPVVASWRRSAVAHGLDPAGPARAARITQAELSARRDRAGPLHDLSARHLDALFDRIRLTGSAVFLTDDEGTVLAQRCATGDEADFASWNLWEGTDWSEAREGTNGIGTCIVEMRPTIIHRDEHFRLANVAMSCVDAPIYGPEGALVGALDVSSARGDQSRALNHLMLDQVCQTAAQIEADLFGQAFQGARIVVVGPEETGRRAWVAVDRDDVVVGATRAARRRFNLPVGTPLEAVPYADLVGAPRDGLDGAEQAALRRALLRHGGNMTAAAKALGMSRATLYRRMGRDRRKES